MLVGTKITIHAKPCDLIKQQSYIREKVEGLLELILVYSLIDGIIKVTFMFETYAIPISNNFSIQQYELSAKNITIM